MIKSVFTMDEPAIWAEFERAPALHLASVTHAGEPILRTFNGVVHEGTIVFHAGDHGDKLEAIGRPVVIQCERIVASIPSYFVDPQRACPASTYFVSCQAEGALERVDALHDKAQVVAALMQRFQAEGGYTPIDAEHPLYRKAIESLLVMRVRPTSLRGKRKLGQNRPSQQIEGVLRGLWNRGAPGDLAALDEVMRHHPGRPRPAFLSGPHGTTLCPRLSECDLDAAHALVHDAYWNEDTDAATSRGAHLGSVAWVGARDPVGTLIATARANSDGRKHATIYDVAVHADFRGRGVGSALMTLLLDHPALRHCTKVSLLTRDAQPFYAPLGFRETSPRHATMLRTRP